MIKINDKSISDYNLLLSIEFAEKHSYPDVVFNEIPGVDGDIVASNDRMKSVLQDYPLYIDTTKGKELSTISDFANYINSLGWVKLAYGFDENYFRLGYNQSEFDIESTLVSYSKVILTYNLKPHKWLISGQTAIPITTSTTLTNPEPCESLPLIKIYGSGSCGITINGTIFTASGVSNWIAFDSETSQAYTTNGNANSQINFYPFPKLTVGNNSIALSGNTTKIEITPRWRRLI